MRARFVAHPQVVARPQGFPIPRDRTAPRAKASSAYVLAALLLAPTGAFVAGWSDEAADPEARGRATMVAAARHAAMGRDPQEVRDVYLDLEDIRIEEDGRQQEGFLRVWYLAPQGFRWEQRPERARRDAVTKILLGDELWIVAADGAVRSVRGTADGVRAIQQAKADRLRFAGLAAHLTLMGLFEEGSTFADHNLATVPDPELKTPLRWVRRSIHGKPDADFFFDPLPGDPKGAGDLRRVRLLPGRTPGATEERWHFDAWRDDAEAQRRLPGRVEAHRMGKEGRFSRFLLAFVRSVRINSNLPTALFVPQGSIRGGAGEESAR